MARAKSYGTGWHGETMRHSRAKKHGKAGGKYSDMTYSQLKKAGIKMKPNSDSDKDGVPNSLDCRPLNKHAQDDGMPAEQPTPKATPVKDFFKRTGQGIVSAEKKLESDFREARKKSSDRHLAELNTKLKHKVENEEDIDVKTLTESELHSLAVIEGEGLLGDNQYEKELKRRIDAEDDLNADLAIERQKSREHSRERIEEFKKEDHEGGLFD